MSEEESTNKRDELVQRLEEAGDYIDREIQSMPFKEQADTSFANLRAEGVDLSAFVSLIPTYERPLNETYRELVILDNDKLKAMSKKKLRRRIRALEAMVLIRDRRLADLEGENDAQA